MSEQQLQPVNVGQTQGIRDAKGRFLPGKSGNPPGMRPGTRHRATKAALALLEGEAELLTRKAVELAMEGDTTALRLCLERLLPPCRETTIELPNMNLSSLTDLSAATDKVLDAVEAGAVTLGQAKELLRLVGAKFDKQEQSVQVTVSTDQSTALSPKTMDMLNTILSRGQTQETIAPESPVAALNSSTDTLA